MTDTSKLLTHPYPPRIGLVPVVILRLFNFELVVRSVIGSLEVAIAASDLRSSLIV